jgi:hypothetical protein
MKPIPITKNPDNPRPLSEARILANRENAKKSTGPRTPEGKAASSRNRLRHGLRANKHFLLDNENPEDFLPLLDNLDATFRPVGEAEEMLVARIAADQWRLDRALPMEAGIFRERLDSASVEYGYRKEGWRTSKRNHELYPDRHPADRAEPEEGSLLGRAFVMDSENENHLANFNRYKGSIEHSLDRSLRQLKIYQTARLANPTAPEPPDSPENPRPVSPAEPAEPLAPAATTPESADCHSNPTPPSAPSSPAALPLAVLAIIAMLYAAPYRRGFRQSTALVPASVTVARLVPKTLINGPSRNSGRVYNSYTQEANFLV